MKLREQIISDMCYTWRHDYGLDKRPDSFSFEAGMTKEEREFLWKQMSQLFDNCIAPHIQYKQTNSKNICDND